MTKEEKDKVVIVVPGANTPEAWNRWAQFQYLAHRLRMRALAMVKLTTPKEPK
jgi:hypothetical protein